MNKNVTLFRGNVAVPGRFHTKLEKAFLLAAQHLPAPQRAISSREDSTILFRTSGVQRP